MVRIADPTRLALSEGENHWIEVALITSRPAGTGTIPRPQRWGVNNLVGAIRLGEGAHCAHVAVAPFLILLRGGPAALLLKDRQGKSSKVIVTLALIVI